MIAASNEHSNSCAYCSSVRSRRASSSSLLGDQPGFRRLEHEREPARLRLRPPPQLVERIAALRRADEDGPALAVGDRRTDDLGPHARVHVGVFIEHHAVEIDAAQGVRIVGAVEPDLSAIGIIGAQLALVRRCSRRPPRRHRIAQIIPGHRFRLLEERREVGETRPNGARAQCRPLQVVNACHRLAGTPMRDDAGKTLGPCMEWRELRSRRIVCRKRPRSRWSTLCGSPAERALLCGDLPSVEQCIVRIAPILPLLGLSRHLRAISREYPTSPQSRPSLSRFV